MPLLDDKTREAVSKRFADLPNPVQLVFFGRQDDPMSPQIRELLDELQSLSPQLEVQGHDIADAGELADSYHLRRTPALVIRAAQDYGVRYYGAPSGYEFESLIDVIGDVSRGDAEVDAAIRTGLAGITDPVHIQVLVTPT